MVKRKFHPHTFWAIVGIHALAAAGVAYWLTHGYMRAAWICFAAMFVIGKIGVSMGNHRYFTHEAFKCKRWVEYALAAMAAAAVQGTLKVWVFWHNVHHAFADGPGDPHRPQEYPGLRGFFWSHCAWTWHEVVVPQGYRRESFEGHFRNPVVAWQARWYWLIVVTGFAVPSLLVCGPVGAQVYGGAAGYARGVLEGVLLAGFIRLVFTWHATWSVNSVAHIFGHEVEERLKKVESRGRNNWFVSALSWFVGEGWHSNHHNYPKCAFLGWKWWQIDFCKPLILAGEKTGQIWGVNYGPADKKRPRE